jgi:hypothetical protein
MAHPSHPPAGICAKARDLGKISLAASVDGSLELIPPP